MNVSLLWYKHWRNWQFRICRVRGSSQKVLVTAWHIGPLSVLFIW